MATKLESSSFVKQLAAKTGVEPGDVVKVLNELGLERFYDQAVNQNGGVPPKLNQAKMMFRLSKNSVVC